MFSRPTAAVLPDGKRWGGFDLDMFDLAGLARAVQVRLYVHKCSPRYCLQDRTSCRFFFPWPCQPQQQFDENVDRVALRRRLPEDDAWVVPHDLELAMFSPATINVLPFDPKHGADQARQYAGKYASKGEKYYFLETQRDGVKDFLKARTVGLCMCHNRLLNFHVVRSTCQVVFTPTTFVPGERTHTRRPPEHIEKEGNYPDPMFFMGRIQQQYLFRNQRLRHLRVEQFHKYFAPAFGPGLGASGSSPTIEDTCENEVAPSGADTHHRHFDQQSEIIREGKKLLGTNEYATAMRRRKDTELAVSRTPFLEPLGEKRDQFYEQRLFLGLPWYCPAIPQSMSDGVGGKRAAWRVAAGIHELQDNRVAKLSPVELLLGANGGVDFEEECKKLESEYCKPEHGLVCECCAGEIADSPCPSCRHAVGFHHCQQRPEHMWWRKGTLHAGQCDISLVLYRLHKKMLPLETLKKKAQAYMLGNHFEENKCEVIGNTNREPVF